MPAASLVVKLSAQIAEFQRSFSDAVGSASKFEKQYAGLASSVQEHQQRINKAFASFGGDNIIREANEFAAAIAKVGGAAKLTSVEQQRVNATVTEALAKYAALGQQAPAALQSLAKATAQIQPIKNPFTGSDLINQANAYVQAVGQIGGASKLTASEQERVNKTVTEAIAKYAALGISAPQSLLNLAKATAQIKPLPDNLFAGTAVIGQAKQYADAVASIGGASRLTASEQRTVNTALTEALAKYKALGKEAPKALRDLANATKEVAAPTTLAQKALSALHSTFGQFTLATLAAGAITKTFSLIGDAIRGLGGLISEAVTKSTEFNNAFLGLGGTAAAFGQDVGKVKDAAKRLSSDGLLPLKDSATSLKNLLAAGFGLDQAVRLVEAFKDSAAFGRQSALSFGDAVRSATEGVKNQNSTLVDNAGVTKNLSVILKEAGFQMQDLSDKTKGVAARQALYNGILRETAAQQGDAAKAANTFSGQLTALRTAYDSLLSTWGDAITQNKTVAEALGAVGAAFRALGTHLADNHRAFNLVSDAVIGLVRLLAGVARAVDIAQQAFNGMDTVLRTTVKGLADAVKAIGDLLIGIIAIASKIPGGSAAIGIAADEITSLIIVTAKAGEVSRSMGDALQKNEERVASWHSVLGGTATSLDSLASSLEKTRGQVVALGNSADKKPLGDLGAGANKSVDAFKSFSKELAKLTAQIDQAASHGTPLSEMLRVFGASASNAAEKANAAGIAVKASVQDLANSFDVLKNNAIVDAMAADWAKVQAHMTDATRVQVDKRIAEFQKEQRAIADASADEYTRMLQQREKYQSRVAEIGLTGVNLQLKHIDDARNAEIRSNNTIFASNVKLRDELNTLTDAYYAHEKKLALGTADTVVERMGRQGVQTKAVLQELAAAAKRDYEQMKASGLFTYQELAAAAERSGAAQKAATGKVVTAWTTAFKNLAAQLPNAINEGFNQNGVIGIFVGAASVAAKEFGTVFAEGMKRTGDVFKDLKFTEKLAGVGAAAAQSFVTGFQSGLQNPGTVSALTSVAGGFLTGLAVGGPIAPFTAGVGAAIGLAGFLAGAFKNAKAEAAALVLEMGKLETQFHGRANLVATAEKAGFSLPTRSAAAGGPPATAAESINALFASGNAEDFNKRVGLLNQALDAYNERLKSLSSATEAVNARTASFAKAFSTPLKDLQQQLGEINTLSSAIRLGAPGAKGPGLFGNTDLLSGADKARLDDLDKKWDDLKAKQRSLAADAQPQFERLGVLVKDTFAGIVKETGNAFDAITQLAPSFQVLKDGISELGLTSTGVIDSLLAEFDLVNNETFKPFFENIQNTGKLVKSLFDAKALSPEGFQAAAADIGQSIQEIVNRGGDMAKTLALSQPVLQSLWEEQQTFGGVTDQTTQSILEQAKQQGLVGEAFKSTQEKVLDVLLAIAKVFHADIPEGIEATQTAAEAAGNGIRDAFGGAATDAAANIEFKIGRSLAGLPAAAAAAGTGIQSGIAAGVENASTNLETRFGKALDGVSKQVDPTVGAAIRAVGLKPSQDAASSIEKSLGGAFDRSAVNLEFKIGRSFGVLTSKARTAADGIEDALSGIDVPPIKIAVDVDSSAIDRLSSQRIDIPALGTGAIVRKRTLAIVGEAGPEVVAPIGSLPGLAKPQHQPTASRVVFRPGSVVINGDVDTNARAERVVRDFARVVTRGGALRTVATRSLGLEKV